MSLHVNKCDGGAFFTGFSTPPAPGHPQSGGSRGYRMQASKINYKMKRRCRDGEGAWVSTEIPDPLGEMEPAVEARTDEWQPEAAVCGVCTNFRDSKNLVPFREPSCLPHYISLKLDYFHLTMNVLLYLLL